MSNEGNLGRSREIGQPKENGPTRGMAKVGASMSFISFEPLSTFPIKSGPSPYSQEKYASNSKA